jgi:hypothetical protein
MKVATGLIRFFDARFSASLVHDGIADGKL